MFSLIGFLIVGGIAGWIAGNVMRGGSMGIPANVLVGVIGAFVGGFLFRLVGISTVSVFGSLLSATVGSLVLLYVVGKVTRK